MTPKSPSAMAILSVVRRDHFSPVIGSPAVSYSSRNSISVTMSAVFFDPFASAAGTVSAPPRHDWEELVSIAQKALDHGKRCGLQTQLKRIAKHKYDCDEVVLRLIVPHC